MIKYGCVALAIACGLAAPAAQAQGNFFVTGQAGQATFDETDFPDDQADTRAFSGGYRWQAGPVAQVGLEVGAGKVDEIGYSYSTTIPDGRVYEAAHAGVETIYRHVGVNARFSFGRDSRWFAIARGGYMRYGQSLRTYYYNIYIIDPVTDSEKIDDSGAYFGAGIGFDISKNVNVNVMVNGYSYSDFEDFYQTTDGPADLKVGTATATTLGVEVRF